MIWCAVVGRRIFDEFISGRALICYRSSANRCMSHGIPSLVEVKMVSTTTHKVLYKWGEDASVEAASTYLMFYRAF